MSEAPGDVLKMLGRTSEFHLRAPHSGGEAVMFGHFRFVPGDGLWRHGQPVSLPPRRPVVRSVFIESWARFSPNGRWIAYMSNESGRWDVYLQSSSGFGKRIRVSSNGGAWPSWSNDGATVYFTAGGNTMAAAIQTESGTAAPALVAAGSARAHSRADLRVVLDWFSEPASHVRPS